VRDGGGASRFNIIAACSKLSTIRVYARLLPLFLLMACAQPHGAITDITGAMPPLAFAMTRANDGADVTAANYRGRVTILYFGYTNCPDECPTTLANLAVVLQGLGTQALDVRVLFVTVDPDRDSPAALKAYVAAFAPQIDGLRGNADDVARLARSYRVTYLVTPASPGHAYEVMHSASVFFFDRDGRARYVATSVANAPVIEADVRRLLK
jgi:protein SCO1/2